MDTLAMVTFVSAVIFVRFNVARGTSWIFDVHDSLAMLGILFEGIFNIIRQLVPRERGGSENI